MRTPLMTLALLSIALAGCSDSPDDDGGSMTNTETGTGTTTTTTTAPGTGTGTGTGTQDPEPEPEPIVLTGTVSGVLDCQLLAQGQDPPTGGDAKTVDASASGRSYSITYDPGTLPAGTAICLEWDDGTTGNSGTVPDGATSVTVYADGAPDGISYTLTID